MSDDLVENIWEAQHMDKIVPSLLYNVQVSPMNLGLAEFLFFFVGVCGLLFVGGTLICVVVSRLQRNTTQYCAWKEEREELGRRSPRGWRRRVSGNWWAAPPSDTYVAYYDLCSRKINYIFIPLHHHLHPILGISFSFQVFGPASSNLICG